MDELITKKQFIIDMELVLDCVIDYIQDNDDLNSVSLVSKKCFDIVSKTRKHVTVHVHFLPEPSRLSIRFPNLESLTLKSCFFGFHTSADKCWIPVTPWIQEISVKFECFKSLCIRNMVVSDSDLQLLAATRGSSLRSLEICGCKMFSDDGLIDISRYCIELTSLRLDNNQIENDYTANGKWLHELALHNTVMESLSFDDTYDMEDVTRLAKKCSNSLVSLDICPGLLSDFSEVFKHAKKLDHFGTGIINEDGDYTSLKFPSSIRGLHLEKLRETSFPFLLPYLNQLRELNIESANLQPNRLCFLIQSCPRLEVLATPERFNRVLTEVYITLTERFNRVALQLVADGSGPGSVKITYTSSRGRATDDIDTPLVRDMLAKGIWKEARDTLGESSLEIIVRIANVESRFASAVSEVGDIKLQGRVKDGVPHLTKVGAFEVDVSLEGHILLCRQVDQGNTSSRVTSILVEENVHINSMSVGSLVSRKRAAMVIGVDKKPSVEALKKINEILAVEQFVFLAL